MALTEGDKGENGELLSGSTGLTRFLYNGRCGVTTDDNGFYYMRQRYYSPELKRFVNQDVVKGNLDNSQSLNRYSYVQGNPVSYTDPFGLSPLNGLFTGTGFWHGVLGLVGCVPGPVGAVANFIDGAIYLAEGDYFGAPLCFVNGLTMGATAAASSLLKAGKLCKVADVAVRVAMVSERIAGGLNFAQNAYNIGKTGIQMYCKYGILGESMGWDTVGEVLSIGLSAMGCVSGLKSMGSTSPELLELKELAARGGLCFVAGTKVKTPDGDKNIEDIAAGDEVYAYDAETGETGSKHVVQTFINEASELAHVTIDGETIDATPTHPFYVIGYGFKPARELLAGEKVLLLNGETKEVENVTTEHLDKPVKVYNFEVEDWHTYYVAEQGVLVHNECGSEANYIIFNKTHKDSMPKPKGIGPNGGRLQSHHGLQQEWAKKNLSAYGYDPDLAPTVTIETGKGMPHTTITNRQIARRDGRIANGNGKWSSSLQDELSYIVSDFRSAGFSDSTISQVLEQQYKMLDKLGVPYERIKF